MPPESTKRFYHKTTQKMELGSESGYKASFAKRKSGLSFGGLQNDVAGNIASRKAFEKILNASGEFTEEKVDDLVKVASLHGVRERNFSPEDLKKINAALSSPEGRAIVDAADRLHAKEELDPWIDQTLSAAQKNPQGIGVFATNHPDHDKAMAMTSAWLNRTGAPTTILNYLAGNETTLNDQPLKLNAAPTLDDLCVYLKTAKQFSETGNGENFEKWEERIDQAVSYARAQISPLNSERPLTANNSQQIEKPSLSGELLWQFAKANKLSSQQLMALAESVPEFSGTQFYQVARGDTLWKIAKHHGISLKSLIETNPQFKNPDTIRPGHTLIIPSKENSNAPLTQLAENNDFLRLPKKSWPETPPLPVPPPVMKGDPFTLDLNGNGLETVGIEQGIHFDLNADGFKEATSWVSKEDGLLVADQNKNGSIDSGQELFGNDTQLASGEKAPHGFAALAEYDSTEDGRVDGQDKRFNELQIWKDDNQNGISESTELHTLKEVGVTSIGLSHTDNNFVDDHQVAHRQTGYFTRSSGQAGLAANLWFKVDRRFNLSPQERLPIPEDIQTLPNAKGYGTVCSLHEAMVRDETGELKSMVTAYMASKDGEEKRVLLTEIMSVWTGQTNTLYNERGQLIDARKLGVVEAFWGEKIPTPEPQCLHARALLQIHEGTLDTLYYQLEGKNPWNWLFEKVHFSSDLATGQLKADFRELIPALMELPGYLTQEDTALVMEHIRRLIRAVNPFDASLERQFCAEMHCAIEHSPSENSEGIRSLFATHGTEKRDILEGTPGRDFLEGGGGNDRILGGAGNDVLMGGSNSDILKGGEGDDLLEGGAGNDSLYGEEGNDTLEGGLGNDALFGGVGKDTFVFRIDSGKDIIYQPVSSYYEEKETPDCRDVVKFEELPFSGIEMLSRKRDDLIVTYGSSSQLTIKNHFNEACNSINEFQFSGGHSLNQEQLFRARPIRVSGEFTFGNASETVQAGSRNDILHGGGGNDTLYGEQGNDVLTGGQGDDTLYGGPGRDKLTGDHGNDKLEGDVGNDTLMGGEGNDILDGGAGNDTLEGGSGSDTYLFGKGSGKDTLHNYADKDSTPNKNDVIQFDLDVKEDQIWFRQVGADLEVSLIGTKSKVTVDNWYLGEAYHVDQFKTSEGKILLDSQVDNLVNAMATFAPPAAGQATLPPSYQDALAGVIAANWK